MKKHLLSLLLTAVTILVFAGDEKPVWELGANNIDPGMTTGKIGLQNAALELDGTNSFSLPEKVFGNQDDFTIEFNIEPPPDARACHNLTLVSNCNGSDKSGIKLVYCPPPYDCAWLFTDGNMTVEYRGFLQNKSRKITIAVKNRQMMLFRDGMLLASTGEFKPGLRPLTFGGIEKNITKPYRLSRLRIFDRTILPEGFDEKNNNMSYYSGDQYFMQRVKLKNTKLPRVLIIGDSISGGYRGFITKYYNDKANIDYWLIGYRSMKGNNSPMERALKGVLSNGPYDVVTFNFGLHYWPKPERSPEDKHVAWMTKVVKLLKQTSPETTFIWIKTTPWRTTPKQGRPSLNNKTNARIIRFNEMTDKIMYQYNIPVVDLYTLAVGQLHTVKTGSRDNVHWPHTVSQLMAGEIVKKIDKRLKKN